MKKTKIGNDRAVFTASGFGTPLNLSPDLITQWEKATNDLCNHFVLKYFGKDAIMSNKNIDSYWIADDVGGVLAINDYFFNVNDILDFLRYKYSGKKMFEYMDYRLKCHEDNADYVINIKSYKKLNGKTNNKTNNKNLKK